MRLSVKTEAWWWWWWLYLEWVDEDGDLLDRDRLLRPVVIVRRHPAPTHHHHKVRENDALLSNPADNPIWCGDVPFHLVEDLHAAYDAAEDSVLAVQMCRRTV